MFGHTTSRRQTRVATIAVAFALLFIGCFSSVAVAKAATLEELQAMIAQLMAQIVALQAANNSGATSSSTSVVHIGSTITTTATLRVRSAAGIQAPFIATQPIGAQGIVVDGPVVKDGYNWFKVDYATGTDGWNVGSWLRERTDLPDMLGKYVGYMDGKQFIATENISRTEALANCKLNATSNPTAVVRCTWRGEEIFVSTSVKSTPRIVEATGPADASFINATIVYGMPTTGMPTVTGPANIGSINWGDGTAVETVFELISGTQKTVNRKHTYASRGSYTITATGLDGKTDTKTVSISAPLPQPKPVVTGLYRGYKSGRMFIQTDNITKADAMANCQTNVKANPTSSFSCEWSGKIIFATGVIYENPDIPVRVLSVTNSKNPVITGSASGTAIVGFSIMAGGGDKVYGSGDVSVNGGTWSSTVTDDLVTGKYTVIVYVANAEVARRDFAVELSTQTNATNTPNKNAFGCGRTISGGTFANGVIGCYGMWDYGSTFGDDRYMCGSYGEGKTGCVIKTSVCTSGSAKATAYYAGSDLTATKLNTVSARLGTTPEIAKNGIAGLWEYTCAPASATVGSITSFTATPALIPAAQNGTQQVTLKWSSVGTGICAIYEDVKGSDSVKLASDQTPAGTFELTPSWASGALTTAKQYRVHCADAVKDTFVDKTVLVKLQAATASAVLGASTDVYAEITSTLAGIQAALDALK